MSPEFTPIRRPMDPEHAVVRIRFWQEDQSKDKKMLRSLDNPMGEEAIAIRRRIKERRKGPGGLRVMNKVLAEQRLIEVDQI